MKLDYVKPTIETEVFVTNEYVAACIISGTIQMECAIPGTATNRINDGTTAVSDHGICGNWSTTTSVTGGIAYEIENGSQNTNRPIYNIKIGSYIGADVSSANNYTYTNSLGNTGEIQDGYYQGTWSSDDNVNHTGTYNHYGAIYATGVQTNNHS